MMELTFRVVAVCPIRCASLKYDSITLWDKMNRIHHFDVFVRFYTSALTPNTTRKKIRIERKRKNVEIPRCSRGRTEKSIKCHLLMVSRDPPFFLFFLLLYPPSSHKRHIFYLSRKIVLVFFTFHVSCSNTQ